MKRVSLASFVSVSELPRSDSRGLSSSPTQKKKIHGWTEHKKGAVSGKEKEVKEAITEPSIQLEPWLVH